MKCKDDAGIIESECPRGHYCTFGIPYECPINTYNDDLGATIVDACRPCAGGHWCFEKGISYQEDYACPVGYYCDQFSDPVPCPAGTYRDTPGAANRNDCHSSPAGYYAPGDDALEIRTNHTVTRIPTFPASLGSSGFYPCIEGTYCEESSQLPLYCPAGYKTKSDGTRSSLEGSCDRCPAGYYGVDSERLVCELCHPGYVCLGGTSSEFPLNEMNDQGYMCPLGHYCPSGSTKGVPCPVATYANATGGTSLNNCTACPAGTYNNKVGQSGCKVCASSAYTNNPGLVSCECIGANRVFESSSSKCICQPNYQSYDHLIGFSRLMEEDDDGIEDCEPIVYDTCSSTQIMSANGVCMTEEELCTEEECSNGTVHSNLGICDCFDKHEDVCDDDCLEFAVTVNTPSTNRLVTSDQQVFDLSKRDDYGGEIECKYPRLNCQVVGCQTSSTGIGCGVDIMSAVPSLLPPASRRRMLSTSTIATNPVLCISVGDSVLFEMMNGSFPVYNKNSLLNANPGFDYGALRELRWTSSIRLFGLTFAHAGVFVLTSSSRSGDTIISVQESGRLCPTEVVSHKTTTVLLSLGIGLTPNIVHAPDWMLFLSFILSMAAITLTMVWMSTKYGGPWPGIFVGTTVNPDNSINLLDLGLKTSKPRAPVSKMTAKVSPSDSFQRWDQADLDGRELIERIVVNHEEVDTRLMNQDQKLDKLLTSFHTEQATLRELLQNGQQGGWGPSLLQRSGSVYPWESQLVSPVLNNRADNEYLESFNTVLDAQHADILVAEEIRRQEESEELEREILSRDDISEEEKELLIAELYDDHDKLESSLLHERSRRKTDFEAQFLDSKVRQKSILHMEAELETLQRQKSELESQLDGSVLKDILEDDLSLQEEMQLNQEQNMEKKLLAKQTMHETLALIPQDARPAVDIELANLENEFNLKIADMESSSGADIADDSLAPELVRSLEDLKREESAEKRSILKQADIELAGAQSKLEREFRDQSSNCDDEKIMQEIKAEYERKVAVLSEGINQDKKAKSEKLRQRMQHRKAKLSLEHLSKKHQLEEKLIEESAQLKLNQAQSQLAEELTSKETEDQIIAIKEEHARKLAAIRDEIDEDTNEKLSKLRKEIQMEKTKAVESSVLQEVAEEERVEKKDIEKILLQEAKDQEAGLAHDFQSKIESIEENEGRLDMMNHLKKEYHDKMKTLQSSIQDKRATEYKKLQARLQNKKSKVLQELAKDSPEIFNEDILQCMEQTQQDMLSAALAQQNQKDTKRRAEVDMLEAELERKKAELLIQLAGQQQGLDAEEVIKNLRQKHQENMLVLEQDTKKKRDDQRKTLLARREKIKARKTTQLPRDVNSKVADETARLSDEHMARLTAIKEAQQEETSRLEQEIELKRKALVREKELEIQKMVEQQEEELRRKEIELSNSNKTNEEIEQIKADYQRELEVKESTAKKEKSQQRQRLMEKLEQRKTRKATLLMKKQQAEIVLEKRTLDNSINQLKGGERRVQEDQAIENLLRSPGIPLQEVSRGVESIMGPRHMDEKRLQAEENFNQVSQALKVSFAAINDERKTKKIELIKTTKNSQDIEGFEQEYTRKLAQAESQIRSSLESQQAIGQQELANRQSSEISKVVSRYQELHGGNIQAVQLQEHSYLAALKSQLDEGHAKKLTEVHESSTMLQEQARKEYQESMMAVDQPSTLENNLRNDLDRKFQIYREERLQEQKGLQEQQLKRFAKNSADMLSLEEQFKVNRRRLDTALLKEKDVQISAMSERINKFKTKSRWNIERRFQSKLSSIQASAMRQEADIEITLRRVMDKQVRSMEIKLAALANGNVPIFDDSQRTEAILSRLTQIESALMQTLAKTSSQVYRDKMDISISPGNSLVIISDCTPFQKELLDHGKQILRVLNSPSITLVAASATPTLKDPSTFQNSFHWDPIAKTLAIRKERMTVVDDFVVVLVHTASHIKMGHSVPFDDSATDFQACLYQALGAIAGKMLSKPSDKPSSENPSSNVELYELLSKGDTCHFDKLLEKYQHFPKPLTISNASSRSDAFVDCLTMETSSIQTLVDQSKANIERMVSELENAAEEDIEAILNDKKREELKLEELEEELRSRKEKLSSFSMNSQDVQNVASNQFMKNLLS